MYIHLDLGWMRHPFPLSSFRISSPDQIQTIRGLGLERVRWAPERSQLEAPQDVDAGEDGGAATAGAAGVTEGADLAPDNADAPDDAAAAAAAARRAALAAQRAADQRLEGQYAEASNALRESLRASPEQPEQARTDIEALARALVDKMLVEGDLCIRLLSGRAGDRAAAHGLNVAVIALLMGRSFGFEVDDMMDLGVGAMLHDLGKLDLPDRVRHFDEAFTSAEVNLYREHVKLGVASGRRMGLSAGALAVVGQHHEHADGSGFPLKLSADRMTMAARIVALVDRYDNLCNPASLSRALTPHEALSMLFAASRHRYDPTVLNAFIRMMGVYPAGSLVQLTDERYAMVVGVNSSRPLKPQVLVHDPGTPRDEALVLDLERADGLGIRRSLNAGKLPRDAVEYLAPRQRVAYYFEPAPAAEDRP